MEENILEPDYEIQNLIINDANLNNFEIIEDERRAIRLSQVNKIESSMGQNGGGHFDVPIVLNKKEGKYRIVDGNHRYEAIKKRIAKDAAFKIIVCACVYHNLTRDEERKLYSKWSSPIKENADDFLQQYWKTVPLGDKILAELPVAIYQSEHKMSLRNFMNAYFNAKRTLFIGRYDVMTRRESVLKLLKGITENQLIEMRRMYDDYASIFGNYNNKSAYYRTSPFMAFARIWVDNCDSSVSKKAFLTTYKKMVYDKWGIWNEQSKFRGYNAIVSFYKQVLSQINRGRQRNRWIEASSSAKMSVENLKKKKDVIMDF